MADREPLGGYRPTPEQELLLRAALREGEEAARAWRRWCATVDVDRADQGSHRLFPMVYRNLEAQEPGPELGRLKGTYRHNWFNNQLLLLTMSGLLRSLEAAGVDTLVLKGAALITRSYKDPGARPMGDFDLLVRVDQVPEAFGALREAGWESTEVPAPEQAVPVRHAISFDKDDRTCDLHWRILQECVEEGGDDGDFWEASVPATVGGVTTRVLCPADQLLHVCVHAARWHEFISPVRWVADAVKVVSAAEDGMDWDRLAFQTRKRRLTLPMRETLGYLRDRWDVDVPPSVMRGLYHTPASRLERIEHAARSRPPTLPRVAMAHWARNARLAGDAAGVGRQLARFPDYYRRFWGLERGWQAPVRAALKVGSA